MKEIEKVEELDALLKNSGNKLVVIDFYADWCGPCQTMAPKLEKMATDFPGVIFAKVNVNRSSDLAVKYGIKSIPHFIFFKNKQIVGDVKGANESGLRSKIQALQ